MPHYSILSIVQSTCPPSVLVSLSRQLFDLVHSSGGVFRGLDNLGVRPLAYRMKAHRHYNLSGKFIRFVFQTSPSTLTAITNALRMEEQVVRFLVTKEKKITPIVDFSLKKKALVDDGGSTHSQKEVMEELRRQTVWGAELVRYLEGYLRGVREKEKEEGTASSANTTSSPQQIVDAYVARMLSASQVLSPVDVVNLPRHSTLGGARSSPTSSSPSPSPMTSKLLELRHFIQSNNLLNAKSSNDITFSTLHGIRTNQNALESQLVSDIHSLNQRHRDERELFEKQKHFVYEFNKEFVEAEKKEIDMAKTMGEIGKNIDMVVEDTAALKRIALEEGNAEEKKKDSERSVALLPELQLYRSQRLSTRLKNTSQLLFDSSEVEKSLYRDFKYRLTQFLHRSLKEAREAMTHVRRRGYVLLKNSEVYHINKDTEEDFRRKLVRSKLKLYIHRYIKTALRGNDSKLNIIYKYIQQFHQHKVTDKKKKTTSVYMTDASLFNAGVTDLLELVKASVNYREGDEENLKKDPRAFEFVNVVREQKKLYKERKTRKNARLLAKAEKKKGEKIKKRQHEFEEQQKKQSGKGTAKVSS